MLRLILTILLFSTVISCDGGDDISFKPSGNKGGAFGTGNNGGNGNQAGTGFGDGKIAGVDLVGDDVIDYPMTEYTGAGNLKSITDNAIQVKSRQEISKEKVTSYTEKFTSTDPTIKTRVEKLVGQTVYVRVPKQELANRSHDSNFKNEPFMMFTYSSNATNRNGSTNLTYNKPMPFIIIPTEMNRYDVLRAAPLTYDFRVRGGAKEFDATMTISHGGSEGDIVRINQVTNIPSDTDGKLFDLFPMPRMVEYHIDTRNKKVLRMRTATYYHNTHYKDRRDMNIDLNLCRYTLKGKVEGSCPH